MFGEIGRGGVHELHELGVGAVRGIDDRGLASAPLDALRHLERMKDRTPDADRDPAKPTRRRQVRKQVVREQRMEIENGIEGCAAAAGAW